MNSEKGIEIIHVDEHSPADAVGIRKGFKLIAVNETVPDDITDYLFESYDALLDLELFDLNGARISLSIQKQEGEPLGIHFQDRIFDKIKTCRNNCIFCFVHQMPKKMRKSLYIKDEDYRLSFLDGSYITMSSITDNELEDIIIKHLSPLYISVHATDEECRKFLLKNNDARPIIPILKKLAVNDISFHTQIVICPDINDNSVLEKSITDLMALQPHLMSLALVPVGLTKYREPLYPLKTFDKKGAQSVLELLNNLKSRYSESGIPFPVWASDEFYIQAESALPEYEEYADFSQIENGVGLTRYFIRNFIKKADEWFQRSAHSSVPENKKTDISDNKKEIIDNIIIKKKRVFLFTGKSFAPILRECLKRAFDQNAFTDKRHSKTYRPCFEIRPVENTFFGSSVTVTGLLTYSDIYDNLADLMEKESFDSRRDVLLIPDIVLSADRIFLDDVTADTALSQGFRFVSGLDPEQAFEDIISALSD